MGMFSQKLGIIAKRNYLIRKGPPKVVSPSEAVSVIRSDSKVFVHGISAVPLTLLNALEKRHKELRNVQFMHLHIDKDNPCSKLEYKESFFTNNFFIGKNQRKQVAQGISSYIPIFLHEVPKMMRLGLMTPDYVLLNVSPPDKHGYCSLGTEVGQALMLGYSQVACALPAVETGKKIIAQINPNMPRTHGYSFVHLDCIDYIVPDVKEPLPEHKTKPPTEVESAISRHIAGLVKDGATLQMGIGSIPDAVLSQLKNHKNLGVHTEMFAEGVIDLMSRGVITNLNKKYLPGKIVTSFVMGSKRLYEFINDNPAVYFLDSSITNNPSIVGSNPKVTAINSAVEVDITGQVCADSIGTRMISGVGGQVDFERGAAISKEGLPIITLPSTTKSGESKIVNTLKNGAGVLTTRHHTHYVVTEYGVAYLFGKNLQERAREMIRIAHPKHRERLEKDAFERLGIKAWRTV